MINDRMLVVLPYKQSGSQGNEIKLALKGWKKYCQFDYLFIVIGEFDDSLEKEFPWVTFIYSPMPEVRENQYNPHLDIMRKFNIVSDLFESAYDGFIYVTDDEYAIKPFCLEDIITIHHHAPSFTGDKNAPTSYWRYDKWKTRQLLDGINCPHINYTTHYPCYFEFSKMELIRKKFNMLNESYVFDDVYFNFFEHEEAILDSTIRLGIWNRDIFEKDFDNAINNPNIKFMCNSVEGWSIELENKLKEIVN